VAVSRREEAYRRAFAGPEDITPRCREPSCCVVLEFLRSGEASIEGCCDPAPAVRRRARSRMRSGVRWSSGDTASAPVGSPNIRSHRVVSRRERLRPRDRVRRRCLPQVPSARDRDRLRQEILERMGWRDASTGSGRPRGFAIRGRARAIEHAILKARSTPRDERRCVARARCHLDADSGASSRRRCQEFSFFCDI